MANLSNNKLKTNNTLFDNNDILFKKYLMKSMFLRNMVVDNQLIGY